MPITLRSCAHGGATQRSSPASSSSHAWCRSQTQSSTSPPQHAHPRPPQAHRQTRAGRTSPGPRNPRSAATSGSSQYAPPPLLTTSASALLIIVQAQTASANSPPSSHQSNPSTIEVELAPMVPAPPPGPPTTWSPQLPAIGLPPSPGTRITVTPSAFDMCVNVFRRRL